MTSSGRRRLRLFLDSNVLTGGLVARWGLDKAVLSLCAARICQLVLAEAVRMEVEENLLEHAIRPGEKDSAILIEEYNGLIRLTAPEIIPFPEEADVIAVRRLISHAADVPVLLSAIQAKPDWLLTHNTKHFTPQVAAKSGLKIATPVEFFTMLSEGINPSDETL